VRARDARHARRTVHIQPINNALGAVTADDLHPETFTQSLPLRTQTTCEQRSEKHPTLRQLTQTAYQCLRQPAKVTAGATRLIQHKTAEIHRIPARFERQVSIAVYLMILERAGNNARKQAGVWPANKSVT